jgi:hypothetical protein
MERSDVMAADPIGTSDLSGATVVVAFDTKGVITLWKPDVGTATEATIFGSPIG